LHDNSILGHMNRKSPPSLFFRNASQVLTLAGPAIPRRGAAMGELGIIPGGGVLTVGGKNVSVGVSSSLEREAVRRRAEAIECRGRVIMPGFVDSHTHLIFAGSRLNDYELRLQGKTYDEIANAGGGIQSSAQRLQAASPAELQNQAEAFLAQFAAHGTTTIEVKSGYGLEIEEELKVLRAIRSLRSSTKLELVPTLMALHAVPVAYRGREAEYIQDISTRLVPTVAKVHLAEFIDCFCDRGAFSVEDCRRVLEAGKQHGLVPRIHAEQLARTGAARLGIELDAASADHLDMANGADIRAISRSNTIATLLPGANFHLGLRVYPPARQLIEYGAAVALATDFNPGTSPTLNMQFILSLACAQMRMTPAEAITAATFNGACALRRAKRLGSLEAGKQADLIVMDVQDYREIPYYFAVNHCSMTIKRGKVIYGRV
jgi:imidazolonepropionase